MSVTDQSELHLQLAFNLAQSFSILGSTVTFNPAINTAAAKVQDESSADRMLEMTGTLVNVSSTAITVQEGDSAVSFTVTVNSSTIISGVTSLSAVPAGAIVRVQAETQTDGTLLAQQITVQSTATSSDHSQDEGSGLVVSVTRNSSGAVTAFTMAPREGFGNMPINSSIQVNVPASTTYQGPKASDLSGSSLPTFDNSEIFPGQAVAVAGPISSTGTLDASRITLGEQSITGSLQAVPQGGSSNISFILQLPASSYLTNLGSISALTVLTSGSTSFGDGVTAASAATLSAGTNLELHGDLLNDSSGKFNFYATSLNLVETPETPENP